MKILTSMVLSILVSACSLFNGGDAVWEEPNYNYIAAHTRVVSKSASHVVYEYKDIRVDEISPIAALYCHDRGGRQASLYEIVTRPDNSRRATFVCQNIPEI